MVKVKLIRLIVIFILGMNIINAQELEYCAVKSKMPYKNVKLKLKKVSINHNQFLQLLDSLVNNEKNCDADFYLECKYFWGITYEQDTHDGFYLYVFLMPYFDTNSSFVSYFLLKDTKFLISKEIIQKKLKFILENNEKKFFLSKTPLEPYYMEELPKWLIYYSYKTQKFYVIKSEATKKCD